MSIYAVHTHTYTIKTLPNAFGSHSYLNFQYPVPTPKNKTQNLQIPVFSLIQLKNAATLVITPGTPSLHSPPNDTIPICVPLHIKALPESP